MSRTTEVTESDFQAKVLRSDKPVLIDFWAPWCGPCRMVAPVVEAFADEREDVAVVKVNVDDNQSLAAQFNIMSIPTLVLVRGGREIHRLAGAVPKEQLSECVDQALVVA